TNRALARKREEIMSACRCSFESACRGSATTAKSCDIFPMRFLNPLWLGAIYGLAELYLALTRRSHRASSRDRGSLLVLWIVIAISIFLAVQMVWLVPGATVRSPIPFYIFGFILFLFGLALRWFSIGYLGRYFTVNVAVSPEQKIVDSGPYRYIR